MVDSVSLGTGISVIFALLFGDASGAEQLQALLLAPDANLREQLLSTYLFKPNRKQKPAFALGSRPSW